MFRGRFTLFCLIKDKIMFSMSRGDEKLLHMKNKYDGKRCFIVALGPSLTVDDLNLLAKHNEFTFSMNRCYQIFPKTSWRPNCYFISDKRAFTIETKKAIADMVKNGIDVVCCKFAAPKNMPLETIYYKARYTDSILQASRLKKYNKKAHPLRCSTDAYRYIYDGRTCVHSIIQLACYMGFHEIYLLGADCGIVNDKSYTNLLDDTDRNIENMNHLGDQYIEDYESLKKDIEKKHLNVKIFNATRGGRLEVFPRVDLLNLFN